MTTNDTAAALAKLLDDVACRRCDHDDPIGDVGREEIDRAITSHVAAEVARALACAGSVDEVIEAFDETSAAYGAAKRGFDLAARERAAAAQVASIDRLRAAIAADKARAVAGATDGAERAERFADTVCSLVGARDHGCGGQTVDAGTARLYADAVVRIGAIIARDKARPTPDEARRLVDEFERLASIDEAYDQRDVARDALLRALGVEA